MAGSFYKHEKKSNFNGDMPVCCPFFFYLHRVTRHIHYIHAAIVAREFGIPAVMGTGSGTKVLKTGMRDRVDGGRGLVLKPRPSREQGE